MRGWGTQEELSRRNYGMNFVKTWYTGMGNSQAIKYKPVSKSTSPCWFFPLVPETDSLLYGERNPVKEI